MDSALCAQAVEAGAVDHNDFFPESAEDADVARSICVSCPVQSECFTYSEELAKVDINARVVGVWGGQWRTLSGIR